VLRALHHTNPDSTCGLHPPSKRQEKNLERATRSPSTRKTRLTPLRASVDRAQPAVRAHLPQRKGRPTSARLHYAGSRAHLRSRKARHAGVPGRSGWFTFQGHAPSRHFQFSPYDIHAGDVLHGDRGTCDTAHLVPRLHPARARPCFARMSRPLATSSDARTATCSSTIASPATRTITSHRTQAVVTDGGSTGHDDPLRGAEGRSASWSGAAPCRSTATTQANRTTRLVGDEWTTGVNDIGCEEATCNPRQPQDVVAHPGEPLPPH